MTNTEEKDTLLFETNLAPFIKQTFSNACKYEISENMYIKFNTLFGCIEARAYVYNESYVFTFSKEGIETISYTKDFEKFKNDVTPLKNNNYFIDYIKKQEKEAFAEIVNNLKTYHRTFGLDNARRRLQLIQLFGDEIKFIIGFLKN